MCYSDGALQQPGDEAAAPDTNMLVDLMEDAPLAA